MNCFEFYMHITYTRILSFHHFSFNTSVRYCHRCARPRGQWHSVFAQRETTYSRSPRDLVPPHAVSQRLENSLRDQEVVDLSPAHTLPSSNYIHKNSDFFFDKSLVEWLIKELFTSTTQNAMCRSKTQHRCWRLGEWKISVGRKRN